MKKYYALRRDISSKTIGLRNAGAQVSFIKDKMLDNQFYIDYMSFFHGKDSSLNLYKTPSFKGGGLNYLELNKGAKITDVMTFMPFNSGAEFLLNKKAYEVFVKYKLGNHAFFQANVYHNVRESISYNILYLQLLDMDIINFEKSVFYSGNSIRGKEFLTFKSFHDYKAFSTFLNVEKVSIFKENFNQDLDVFTIPFSSSIFISKSLKEEIEELQLSGLVVYDISSDFFEIQ